MSVSEFGLPSNPVGFRIFSPEHSHEVGAQHETELSPRMQVRQFVENWYLPVVSRGDKGNVESTEKIVWDAVNWWERLTANPPVSALIDLRVTAEFQQKLATATYRRGRFGREYPLSKDSQIKVVRTLRAVFYRIGPTIDPERPTANLLPRAPFLSRKKKGRGAERKPKRSFPVDVAQTMLDSCAQMEWGRKRGVTIPPTFPCYLWWEAFLLVAFYVGLRSGTQFELRLSMIKRRADGKGAVLRIPAAAVTKTRKRTEKFLHPIALDAIDRLHASMSPANLSQPSDLIFPWPYCYEHFSGKHEALQSLAGIPKERWLSPHAWRRTHSKQMAKAGAERSTRIAQASLDHSDGATTRRHYVNLQAYFIRRLPKLTVRRGDPRQRRLFSAS